MKNYKCNICGEEFENQIEFAKHILKCEEKRKKAEEEKAKIERETIKEKERKEIEQAYQAFKESVSQYIQKYGTLEIKDKNGVNLTISTSKMSNYYSFNSPFYRSFLPINLW